MAGADNWKGLGHRRDSWVRVLLVLRNMAAYDIRERAFEFACAMVGLYQYLLEKTRTPRQVADQLLSAGTSIGANLEEAEVAHSKPDFVAKNSIALKEAREARYWLRLIRACKLAPDERVSPHLQESTELVLIIAAIRRNSRGHGGPQTK